MSERAIGMVRSAGAPARRTSEISRSSSATTISVEWSGCADACGAVCVGVVGGAGHGGSEHEQDRRHKCDICGGRLVQQVKDDDQQERADRDVRCGGMQRVPQPGAVEEVLERADGSEEGAQPAMVELTERRRPSVLCGDEPGDQTTHFIPPGRVYPQSVHSGVKFGDNFRDFATSSWTSLLWGPGPPPYISSCPKGQIEPPDRFEERSSGRSLEPGSPAARQASEEPGGDQGLRIYS